MVVLTMGALMPTVQTAGIDPIWFGIFIIFVVEMAQITPPVGFNLFVLQGMTGLYNWWSLYLRLANPQSRREAITSRPWLMSSVGRRTEHAGQTTITLTGMHSKFRRLGNSCYVSPGYCRRGRKMLRSSSTTNASGFSAASISSEVWLRSARRENRRKSLF